MHCYDCTLLGEFGDAVGVCHLCGAAVCVRHVHVADVPVQQLAGVGTATSPRAARRMSCLTCRAAEAALGTRGEAAVR
ncbi:DUF2180 family protein [Streptomyces sp. NPDC008313]|uniref:DUF2180 family protein n=1 Tax=Streptomyces sp. NPDC008313 TaxID=3364826 RepID=UPI0036EACEE3